MYYSQFKHALEGYEKFWNKEKLERCILGVTAPLNKETFRQHSTLEEKWLDEEYIYALQKHNATNS